MAKSWALMFNQTTYWLAAQNSDKTSLFPHMQNEDSINTFLTGLLD